MTAHRHMTRADVNRRQDEDLSEIEQEMAEVAASMGRSEQEAFQEYLDEE